MESLKVNKKFATYKAVIIEISKSQLRDLSTVSKVNLKNKEQSINFTEKVSVILLDYT